MHGTNRTGWFSKSYIVLLVLFAPLFSGCDSQTHVTIEGGAIPVFTVTGRGNIRVITVSGPDFANPKRGEPGSYYVKPYWEIAPQSEYDVRRLENSGGLVYGKVPDGFRQVVPAQDAPPQPLPEDEFLTFQLRVANANGVGVRFVIHNGKPAIERS